mgnify:FL=1
MFVAGANIVITNGIGGNNRTLATTLTPSFTTVALTATTNQAVFGTTTTTTLNIPTPSSSRTHTLNDPGTNSFFVMGDGDQTINGIKSFNSAPVSRSSVGHKFNNVGNTATTTVIPSVSLVSNNNFPLPSNNPSANQVLMTDGQNSTWTSTSSLRGVTITYCSGTADKSIAATNADRSISPGCGTNLNAIIPANTLTAGSTISIEARGTIAASFGTTMNFNLFFNSTAICTVTAFPLSTPSTWGFVLLMEATIRTIGATGTVVAEIEYRSTSNAGTISQMISQSTATTVIDTTNPILVDPHIKFSVAGGSAWTQKKFFVKGTIA